PFADRVFRRLVSFVLPRPRLFRLALLLARPATLVSALLPRRLRSMVESLPARVDPPSPTSAPQVFAAEGGVRRKRVAMLTGCAQQVLGGRINEATVRILRRHGCEVIIAAGAGCCGALTHHMGREADARVAARANLAAWGRELDGQGLDAIVINASGCGTTVKDYGHLFADDPEWRDTAARVAELAVDVTELLADLGVRADAAPAGAPVVAYHDACSLQHGQRLSAPPRALLAASGFDVREIAEGHMCCGAAGTYTLLQPELSGRLGRRKAANVRATAAAVVAAGNLGCLLHLERFSGVPALHTVELLDWATGGPRPRALSGD
ncbi:MAG: heterodisulfide reductase-related iron-sulfur binding cluster, partial [Proteobacteria bacterium]|nr:heterodisulfide reductase-related iron-sulfur binding cluster [Pseudomonadota bacterium]